MAALETQDNVTEAIVGQEIIGVIMATYAA